MQLLPDTASHIKASQSIMLSPVIIGVKQSVAQSFGWENNPAVTWKDIQSKAAAGQFHFAMTNPAASNSGFTALIGVASALSGSSDAIDTGQIDTQALKGFFSGQTVTAGSSGFLADTYVRQQDTVDGIINYESVLMGLNSGGQLHEPLDLIYPSEGIVTADYPFMLLNEGKRDAYDKVVAWLRTPDVQRRIMTDTSRRPSVPGIPLDARFPTQTLVELPFPSKLDTIDALLTVYLDQIRRPASAVFVLDTSGSMQGERLDSLKQALEQIDRHGYVADRAVLALPHPRGGHAADLLVPPSISRRRSRSTTPTPTPQHAAIRAAVDAMEAGGGTAIYSALSQAYDIVQAEQASDPNRLWSIVLMTDGENNDGIGPDTWRAGYGALPQRSRTCTPTRSSSATATRTRCSPSPTRPAVASSTRSRPTSRRSSSRSAATSERHGAAVSFARRFEAYLYSRRNIVGSALALGGLGLFFTGLLSGPIWAPVVAALYAIGVLLTPTERTDRLEARRDRGRG